jgi:hypothetical protein
MNLFYAPWVAYIQMISAPPASMERCTHERVHGGAGRPSGCESHFAVSESGASQGSSFIVLVTT